MTSKKGFTLIELLVVVLIIGILAGIGLPEYKRSLKRTYTAEAAELISSLRNAMNLYSAEYGSQPTNLEDLSISVKQDDLNYYTYSYADGIITIAPAGSNDTNATLTLSSNEDGSPRTLSCSGADCNMFKEFL